MTLKKAKQLIDVVQHLYDCGILHRDISPSNILYDSKSDHIKLIDFGFARTFDINENKKRLEIEGVISYADLKFLKIYTEAILKCGHLYLYEYDKKFDITCAINVIIDMKDDYIDTQCKIFEDHYKNKFDIMYRVWEELKENNKYYNDILNVINNLTGAEDFIILKNLVEQLFC